MFYTSGFCVTTVFSVSNDEPVKHREKEPVETENNPEIFSNRSASLFFLRYDIE